MLTARLSVAILALLITACSASDPARESAAGTAPQTANESAERVEPVEPLPPSADLRPRLLELGLGPRAQGPRGTCSIFTTCAAIEWALAKHDRAALRLSPEFLNWSAGRAAGAPSDGNFFHNALAGFEQFGICAESSAPYRDAFDAAYEPPQSAMDEAHKLHERVGAGLSVRWIVPWQPNRFGVNDEQLSEIRRVLAHGDPVAAGSGHSRLLVGYRDDASAPGGGIFLTSDSALARFDEVSYAFVREQVADVFWIESLR